MKKSIFIVMGIVVLVMLASCTQNVMTDDLGTITFTTDMSRGISASIEYPALLDKTWTLVAQKKDKGGTTGEGTYENFLLTDDLNPFSVGLWQFTITDSTGKISGSVTTNVKAGNNAVPISVHSTANKGILSIENCNFLISKIGNVLYVDLYLDGERINTDWVTAQLTSEDGDYYVLPTITQNLSQGVHTVRLYYATALTGRIIIARWTSL